MRKTFTQPFLNSYLPLDERAGFTLIELIVVIAIIAILAAIIAPNAFKAIEKAKVSQQIATMKGIKTAIETLYVDTGQWIGDDSVTGASQAAVILPCANDPWLAIMPNIEPDNLITDDAGWPGWDGPYVEKFSGANAWGGINRLERYTAGIRAVEYKMVQECCASPTATTCLPPESSLALFDRIIDGADGNNAGNFRHPTSSTAYWQFIRY